MICSSIDDVPAAVALVIFSPLGRIHTLLELNEEVPILKKRGMVSIPCESMKRGEKTPDTVWRLIDEEIGVAFCEEFYILPQPLNDFVHGYPVYVALAQSDTEFSANPVDADEVAFNRWMHPDELLKLSFEKAQTRLETQQILAAAIAARGAYA